MKVIGSSQDEDCDFWDKREQQVGTGERREQQKKSQASAAETSLERWKMSLSVHFLKIFVTQKKDRTLTLISDNEAAAERDAAHDLHSLSSHRCVSLTGSSWCLGRPPLRLSSQSLPFRFHRLPPPNRPAGGGVSLAKAPVGVT